MTAVLFCRACRRRVELGVALCPSCGATRFLGIAIEVERGKLRIRARFVDTEGRE